MSMYQNILVPKSSGVIMNPCGSVHSSEKYPRPNILVLKFKMSIRGCQRCNFVHSPQECLVWDKKCCHVWLDHEPSLLTNKLWLIFMGKKTKNKKFFLKKKIQNGRLKKSVFFKIANSQNFFLKISWIGPWVRRIDWCEGHWFISTYMAVRLSWHKGKNRQKMQYLCF